MAYKENMKPKPTSGIIGVVFSTWDDFQQECQMKISKAIHGMLKQWDKKGFSPSAINCGNCDEFAWELAKKFPRGRALWGDDCRHYFTTNVNQEGHCFFKYGKKFYDSESPQGVFYPDELQYYQRSNKEDNEYWQKNRKQNRKCA